MINLVLPTDPTAPSAIDVKVFPEPTPCDTTDWGDTGPDLPTNNLWCLCWVSGQVHPIIHLSGPSTYHPHQDRWAAPEAAHQSWSRCQLQQGQVEGGLYWTSGVWWEPHWICGLHQHWIRPAAITGGCWPLLALNLAVLLVVCLWEGLAIFLLHYYVMDICNIGSTMTEILITINYIFSHAWLPHSTN